jgi:hypothetical protein
METIEFRTKQIELLAEGIRAGFITPAQLSETVESLREMLSALVAYENEDQVPWSLFTGAFIASGTTALLAYDCSDDQVSWRINSVRQYAKDCAGCYDRQYMLSNRSTLRNLATRMLRKEHFDKYEINELIDRSLIVDFSSHLTPA